MLEDPESPRSTHSSLSSVSSSPPMLDPGTLSILDSFLSSRAEEENLFSHLAEQAASAQVSGLALDTGSSDEETENAMISVDEFRRAFGEDWQLSQFWYTTTFANRLAKHIHSLCDSSSKVAFVCCPTGFVAFQHLYHRKTTRLLEFDQRFSVLAPKSFVRYDLDEPDNFPSALKGSIDIAVVDPPFLNETTNRKLAQTLRQILHPTRGKLIMVTSTSVEHVLVDIFSEEPLGPLRRALLTVQHERLANDFACWGSWKGAQDFGTELFE